MSFFDYEIDQINSSNYKLAITQRDTSVFLTGGFIKNTIVPSIRLNFDSVRIPMNIEVYVNGEKWLSVVCTGYFHNSYRGYDKCSLSKPTIWKTNEVWIFKG